ncbi:MAG: IS5 family transposase [Pseudomonadota bacterium]
MLTSKRSRAAKQRYRVTNWPDYNRALVNRGSLMLWISDDVLKDWRATSGRGQRYTDTAIICALCLKVVLCLPLRQTQGFLESLKQLLGLAIAIPHYSTLSRRASQLVVPQCPRLRPGEHIHLAVDSTGLKVFGEGEWKTRVHGKDKRRTWRKLHLGVDSETGEVHAHQLTGNDRGDGPELSGLLDQIDGSIEAVYGDKGYDSFACHRAVLDKGAKPVIPAKKGASSKPPPTMKDPPTTRGAIVQRCQEIGRKEWKKESGYHRRSLAETAMFRYKTIISPSLKARKMTAQKTEAAIAIHILNRFTALGMPKAVEIK